MLGNDVFVIGHEETENVVFLSLYCNQRFYIITLRYYIPGHLRYKRQSYPCLYVQLVVLFTVTKGSP